MTHSLHCVFLGAYRQTSSCSSNPAWWQLASFQQLSYPANAPKFSKPGYINSKLFRKINRPFILVSPHPLYTQPSHYASLHILIKIKYKFLKKTHTHTKKEQKEEKKSKMSSSEYCSLQPAVLMAILTPKSYYWDKWYKGEVPQTVTQGPKWPFIGH